MSETKVNIYSSAIHTKHKQENAQQFKTAEWPTCYCFGLFLIRSWIQVLNCFRPSNQCLDSTGLQECCYEPNTPKTAVLLSLGSSVCFLSLSGCLNWSGNPHSHSHPLWFPCSSGLFWTGVLISEREGEKRAGGNGRRCGWHNRSPEGERERWTESVLATL